MSDQINAGSVVKLKSGWPLMTVTHRDTDVTLPGDYWWCEWFVKEIKKGDSFAGAALEIADSSKDETFFND